MSACSFERVSMLLPHRALLPDPFLDESRTLVVATGATSRSVPPRAPYGRHIRGGGAGPNLAVDTANDAVDLRAGQFALALKDCSESGDYGAIIADDFRRRRPRHLYDYVAIVWIKLPCGLLRSLEIVGSSRFVTI